MPDPTDWKALDLTELRHAARLQQEARRGVQAWTNTARASGATDEEMAAAIKAGYADAGDPGPVARQLPPAPGPLSPAAAAWDALRELQQACATITWPEPQGGQPASADRALAHHLDAIGRFLGVLEHQADPEWPGRHRYEQAVATIERAFDLPLAYRTPPGAVTTRANAEAAAGQLSAGARPEEVAIRGPAGICALPSPLYDYPRAPGVLAAAIEDLAEGIDMPPLAELLAEAEHVRPLVELPHGEVFEVHDGAGTMLRRWTSPPPGAATLGLTSEADRMVDVPEHANYEAVEAAADLIVADVLRLATRIRELDAMATRNVLTWRPPRGLPERIRQRVHAKLAGTVGCGIRVGEPR